MLSPEMATHAVATRRPGVCCPNWNVCLTVAWCKDVSMRATGPDFPTIFPATRAEWRAWLEVHHTASRGVLLIYGKKGGRAGGIGYEEAVEEALCFGWIDSKAKSVDAERSLVTFTPRKPGGTWAKSNKERVARLIEQGRMTPAGMAKIEQAQADGSWDVLDALEDPTPPEDLAAALAANAEAARNFAAFSPGTRLVYLRWIRTAKRPETRARRVAETVRLAAQNIRNPQPTTRRD